MGNCCFDEDKSMKISLAELRDKLSKGKLVFATVASGALIERDVPDALQGHQWLEVPGSRQTAGKFSQCAMCALVKDYQLDFEFDEYVWIDDRFDDVKELTLSDSDGLLEVTHTKNGVCYRVVIDDTFHIVQTTL